MALRRAKVDKDTWFEFLVGGLCGLCGNSGYVNVSGLLSPIGRPVPALVRRHCICPNGRVYKFADDKESKSTRP